MLFGEERLTGRPEWYVFGKAWHIPIFGFHWPKWVLALICILVFSSLMLIESLKMRIGEV